MLDPHGKTNARHVINLVGKPLRTSSVFWFNSVAETLVRGPTSIFVRRDGQDYHNICDFERIVCAIFRHTTTTKASWSIYRQDREWNNNREEGHYGFVLRHASWDPKADEATRARDVAAGPRVLINTRYFADQNLGPIIHACQVLDALLIAGIPLGERGEVAEWAWDELSISRSFDWGAVDLVWNFMRRNDECEAAIFTLTKTIESLLREHEEQQWGEIEALEMWYPNPDPEAAQVLFTPSANGSQEDSSR